MKGIPFLLIVLIGVGVVYAYMYMKPSTMREGMSGIPAPKGGATPFVGPPPSGRPEDKTLNGESHEIPEGVLGEISDNDMPGTVEGFQSNGVGCNPRVVRMTNLTAGAPPGASIGALVGAPYGELASTAPQYYRDPENETASRERIITSAAQVRGFLSFEAPLMRGLSDPAVQLPLSQAKADLPRLEQELYFLQQNPGLQSKLKVIDLDTVDSNIDYLQQKYRLGVNTGLIQRPVSFQDSGISVLRNLVKGIDGFTNGTGGPVPSTSASSIVPEFQPEAPTRASLADLNDAVKRMTAERIRLNASGTNNPVMTSRVAQIGEAINNIQGVIQQVNDKTLRPDEIPIRKDELISLFANMGNMDMPLGTLTMTALPASAQNLLPPGLNRDAESQNIVAGLAQKYMDAFLKGTSFEFSLGGKYTSENEVASANRINVVNLFEGGRLATLDNAFAPLAGTMPAPNLNTVPNGDNLSMAATGAGTVPMAAAGDTTDPYAYDPRQGAPGIPTPDARPDDAAARRYKSTSPAHFDWKERSKIICENARKRGLNPAEFGCLPAKTEVSKDFSWRGYTKMICNRLMTNYYTGTDVACGCPPADWSGWNLTVPPVPNPPRIPGSEPASKPPPNF